MTKQQMLSNNKLKQSLSDMESLSKNSIQSYDSINQLWIDDSSANQVLSGDYESYNIPAYRTAQDSTILYNVFLEKQIDGTFESYLLTYHFENNYDINLIQEVISFSKEPLGSNYQINNDMMDICGLSSGMSCDCYTLQRENLGDDNFVYRWDFMPCADETIGAGDSAGGGGLPPNGPPDTNVPSDPIDSDPIDSDPTGDPTSNGIPGGTDASSLNDQVVNDCPHTNTPSLGDGRCGSVSKPLLPLISVSDDTQAFFDSLNNPTDINLLS